MGDEVLEHFGLTEADRLGTGWESRIYALGADRILRIPHPAPGAEKVVRAQAAFTAGLPKLAFALPRVREISFVAGALISVEDRIAGRPMDALLPELEGERRKVALAAYLSVAAAMAGVKAEGEYGDLLLAEPLRCAHWGEYLTKRLAVFAEDAVLARDVPGFDGIVERLRAGLLALPDPEKCVVHGDIWPPNVMMGEDLRVTGLIDFSFTTRVGDTLMDLAGVVYFQQIGNPRAAEDTAFLMGLIEARHGAEVRERLALYAVWLGFSFAYNHEAEVIYPWCLGLIRGF